MAAPAIKTLFDLAIALGGSGRFAVAGKMRSARTPEQLAEKIIPEDPQGLLRKYNALSPDLQRNLLRHSGVKSILDRKLRQRSNIDLNYSTGNKKVMVECEQFKTGAVYTNFYEVPEESVSSFIADPFGFSGDFDFDGCSGEQGVNFGMKVSVI